MIWSQPLSEALGSLLWIAVILHHDSSIYPVSAVCQTPEVNTVVKAGSEALILAKSVF